MDKLSDSQPAALAFAWRRRSLQGEPRAGAVAHWMERNSSGASAPRPPWRPGWTPCHARGAALQVAGFLSAWTAGVGRYISDMCSHYQAEKRRKQIEKRSGIRLPSSGSRR